MENFVPHHLMLTNAKYYRISFCCIDMKIGRVWFKSRQLGFSNAYVIS